MTTASLLNTTQQPWTCFSWLRHKGFWTRTWLGSVGTTRFPTASVASSGLGIPFRQAPPGRFGNLLTVQQCIERPQRCTSTFLTRIIIPVGKHFTLELFKVYQPLWIVFLCSTRLVIINVNVEILLRFILYHYLSPDRTLLKTLHKNGAPQAKNLRVHRSETSDSFRKLTQIVSKSKNFPPAAGSYGNYFR